MRFTLARLANNLGVAAKRWGRLGLAERAYRVATATKPSDPRLVAALHHNLAGLDHARGRYAEAEPVARAGLGLREQLVDANSPPSTGDPPSRVASSGTARAT